MPNLIEQQDLLKGLPDNRLATLLQNPVATIPPFLVAAEAQRRQAIRQQFAGADSKESVVDTLTKQMANVPENIRATPQMTPPVPPTPQMQGVMALQQPEQQMRHGGMVQRYADQGLVTPFRGRQGAGGYTPGAEPPGFGILPDIADYFSNSPLLERIQKYGLTPSPEQMRQIQEENRAAEVRSLSAPEIASDIEAQRRRLAMPAQKPAVQPPKADVGKTGTSGENKAKSGSAEDDIRKQLEAMYGYQEPSDWEKAQRWFAMSEQFLDPSKTTMQSIAAAGRAFSEAAGGQEQERRAAELAQKKALFDYDLAIRQAEAKRREDAISARDAALKAKTGIATGQLDDLRRERRDIAERIRSVQSGVMKGEMDQATADAIVGELQGQYNDLGAKIASYEGFISTQYGFPLIEQANLSTGKISTPGT